MIMQLTNHCSITLSKETLPLLHPLGIFSSLTNACVRARNLTGAYVKIFTGVLLSHNAQNCLMDTVTVAFFNQEYVTIVSSIKNSSF